MTLAEEIISRIAKLDSADVPSVMLALAARLAERSQTPAPTADTTLLDVSEIATRLKKSPSWIYHHKKSLPFLRQIGGSLRASPADIDRYLATRRR